MRTVFLIKAHDKTDAQNKAEQLGRRSEYEYLNCDQETVKWKLVEIIEVQEIESFEHGVELHSYLNWS